MWVFWFTRNVRLRGNERTTRTEVVIPKFIAAIMAVGALALTFTSPVSARGGGGEHHGSHHSYSHRSSHHGFGHR